jgi:RNA polymerase sigma factor (sigma-70 family)
MLWHPEDAKDATQEILIRVVTNLGDFRGGSAFTTWVYQIATNYLLTTRQRKAEREAMTFDRFSEDLDEGLSDEPLQYLEAEQKLLLEEVKIGCTQAMLLCLDREHRLAYILGEILDLGSEEGAYIMEVTPNTFRKRLSRSRKRVSDFMMKKCGLVNQANPCRCHRRVRRAVEIGRVDPNNLLFAGHPVYDQGNSEIVEQIHEIEKLRRSAAIYRGHPEYSAPSQLAENIRRLIDSGNLRVLD